MREVSKDEFWAAVMATALNIHPRITNDRWPYVSDWEVQSTGRALFGRSTSDDSLSGGATAQYWLTPLADASPKRADA